MSFPKAIFLWLCSPTKRELFPRPIVVPLTAHKLVPSVDSLLSDPVQVYMQCPYPLCVLGREVVLFL